MPTSPELDLQIVALLRYVDSCRSAATPHPDCPFATDATSPPTRCLEECQETVSALLRRGRAIARTGPDFDAGQIRLSEPKGAPDATWHVSSLIQEVIKSARSFPYLRSGDFHLKRWVYGTSALGALGYRGLDPASLMRYGLGNYVKIGLSSMLERADEDPDAVKGWPHYEYWRDLFGSENDGGDSRRYFSAAFRGSAERKLESWLATAPLEDILRWVPPMEGSPMARRPPAELELWTWLVERFTRTYLDSWSMESLKQEYLLLKGEVDPAVPEDVLAERLIQPASLAYQIAELAVRRHSQIDPGVLGALTEQAVELLRNGQRRAAAALFDGARVLSPGDPRIINNYAFCILLDRPSEARELFRDALGERVSSPAVTLCNLALVEYLAGNLDASFARCEEVLQHPDGSAFLWRKNDTGDWEVDTTSSHQWTLQFAASMEAANSTDRVWAERLAASGD